MLSEYQLSVPFPKAIAFYLPQYHPIPENDAWWGKGFTEWRNVAKARPLFAHHYQPHLPADLGFYDLRLPEARLAQTELARSYGIQGFCYYHYWFNGRRVLQRPFEDVLASGEPDFPFCLCWANENWTRRWDGSDDEILLQQNYCEQDDHDHLISLLEAFRDPRYIRIDDKPLFLVYRTSALPDPARTAAIWRTLARDHGIGDLHLVSVESKESEIRNPHDFGFDAAVEFQPCWPMLESLQGQAPSLRERIKGFLKKESPGKSIHRVVSYPEVCRAALARAVPPYPRFPCVTPSWDNTARRRWGGIVLQDATPERYGQWLRKTVEQLPTRGLPEPVLFINAWNEWAEGNHLEPDQRWGTRYLEETLSALSGGGIQYASCIS
ncbi:glycoside hydrolase family 99-like domain-containing protein [Cyanobium gracile]|uniref:glycosyltransferase WbsX family protein n=1 Tax=Cyanobium gracile TaxID=59930 RepID=UPI002B1FC707|nr:glycoside hydrolase family 99-like domain-containing protein [Cyanobium gracile]